MLFKHVFVYEINETCLLNISHKRRCCCCLFVDVPFCACYDYNILNKQLGTRPYNSAYGLFQSIFADIINYQAYKCSIGQTTFILIPVRFFNIVKYHNYYCVVFIFHSIEFSGFNLLSSYLY